MKIISCLLLLLFLSHYSTAQQDSIEPERPSETQTAATVGKKTLQVEAGFKIEKTTADMHRTSQPELLLRFGLLEKLELRLDAAVSRYSTKIQTGHVVTTGLEPVALGFKAALFKGNRFLPQAALIADVTIPGFSSEKFKMEHAAPRIKLAFQNDINEKLQLGYNAAAEWDGTDTQPEWVYTFSPSFEISPACQVYIEAYGRIKNNDSPETGVDGGLLFFISKNVTLDISSGFGLSEQAPEYFVSVGGAIRFK